MIGTFGERERTETGYRLTPWIAGRATLVAAADTPLALLCATLAGLLAASSPEGVTIGAADGRSVAIRGEADSLDALALAFFEDLRDQVETFGVAVAGVEIAGTVRAEHGLIGWGHLLLASGPAVALAPLRVVHAELEELPAPALTLVLEWAGESPSEQRGNVAP